MSSQASNQPEETQTSESLQSQNLLADSTQQNTKPPPPPAPVQRSRFSYAKKQLIAPHSFWLDRNYVDLFSQAFPGRDERTPLHLDGRVVSCPSSKNGNMYVIVWDLLQHPTLNPQWLKRHFKSSQYLKGVLKNYILDFVHRRKQSSPNRKNPPSQENNNTLSNTTAAQPTVEQTQGTHSLDAHQVTQTATGVSLPTTGVSLPTTNRDDEMTRNRNNDKDDDDSSCSGQLIPQSQIPSTAERAQRRAQLNTATEEDASPTVLNSSTSVDDEENQDTTPAHNIQQQLTRLFGSGTTTTDSGGSSRRNLRSAPATTQDDSSDSDTDDEENACEDPEYHDRPENALDDRGDSDLDYEEERTEDEEQENSTEPTTIREMMNALVFSYQETEMSDQPSHWIGNDANHRSMYNGPDGLKDNVAESFTTPFECLQFVGGLSMDLIARLANATNDYFHQKIEPKLPSRRHYYHSQRWVDVSLEEMVRFLGLLLMMSLRPVDAGGYTAHFQTTNRTYNIGVAHPVIEIKDTAGWASKYMKLGRFRQIRGAFHLEEKSSARGGDKCHQLRKIITACNAGSKRSFRVPRDLAFDEGGIGCRSRYCPVRQYNKDKPQKFRVDFFILSSSTTYAILHIDVYQGKNPTNAYIKKQAKQLPTTMKAVVNACYALQMHKMTDGYRHVSMDNRYTAPRLAVALRDRLRLFSTGTCRANRKGWNSARLNLKKGKTNRGETLLFHDPVNGLIFGQWSDSKVVNFVSSYEDVGSGKVLRQVGPNKVELLCPVPLIRYQQNMGGVDNGDQMRLQFGGFGTKVKFKKWYKKAAFGIMDVMLLNSYIAWNLSAGERARSRRSKLTRCGYYTVVAQQMCEFVAPVEVDALGRRITANDGRRVCEEGHFPVSVDPKKQVACAVCLLEYRWRKDKFKMAGLHSNVGTCAKCGITAHLVHCGHKRREGWRVHGLQEFERLTCFEIVHSEHGRNIFVPNNENSRYRYSVKKNHPIIMHLRECHGLTPCHTRKRRADEAGDDNETQQQRRARARVARTNGEDSSEESENIEDEGPLHVENIDHMENRHLLSTCLGLPRKIWNPRRRDGEIRLGRRIFYGSASPCHFGRHPLRGAILEQWHV